MPGIFRGVINMDRKCKCFQIGKPFLQHWNACFRIYEFSWSRVDCIAVGSEVEFEVADPFAVVTYSDRCMGVRHLSDDVDSRANSALFEKGSEQQDP